MKEPKGAGAARIYAELRERILNLDLAPGEPLEEAALERLLGTSRTPVREALIRLAAEGLVEHVANRGARVAPIGVELLPQYFEALDLLQRAVTRWAAQRRTAAQAKAIARARDGFERAARGSDPAAMNEANSRFHAVIGEACGNRLIARQYGLLLDEGVRLARLTLAYGPAQAGLPPRDEHLARILADHRDMAEAIAEGDAHRAEVLAAGHARLFRSRVDAYLAQNLASAVAVEWRAA